MNCDRKISLSLCFSCEGSSFQWTPVLNGVGQILSELYRVWNCPLADTYSYADWQCLQWLPVTPTFASPVQRYKAEGLAVSRPLSEATHNWTREQRTKYSNWFNWIWGLSNGTKLSPNFFYTLFLYLSYFPEFIGQFLQPPDFGHRQAEPCLARHLCSSTFNFSPPQPDQRLPCPKVRRKDKCWPPKASAVWVLRIYWH